MIRLSGKEFIYTVFERPNINIIFKKVKLKNFQKFLLESYVEKLPENSLKKY